ncbi:Sec14 cytosolic, putative [Ichthyophthirius multifiliis]|uniref:Sec14 cytosolic, putative n=1 Tax=Ichthyophthirius multifiliis TaxID=5932 RepID=G0QN69_ICHMU|nr:Sec14 cytosolic, putative [Ichthyophthirius multifiliis]EGR33341.1 Sec14 cytosolic, putative [Ichthyophthirius multifiliis]|eukprot:XP_004037327.1 Sec14 cytosolic, putative [Ichthyophthirius multifiliis]
MGCCLARYELEKGKKLKQQYELTTKDKLKTLTKFAREDLNQKENDEFYSPLTTLNQIEESQIIQKSDIQRKQDILKSKKNKVAIHILNQNTLIISKNNRLNIPQFLKEAEEALFEYKKQKETEDQNLYQWDYVDIENQIPQKYQEKFMELRNTFRQKSLNISELYIFRFYKSTDFNYSQTYKLLNKNIQWRIQNNIDFIFEECFSEVNQIKKMSPHGLHFVDFEGKPLFFWKAKHFQFEKLINIFKNKKRLIQYIASYLERILLNVFQLCSIYQKRQIHKLTFVIDFKNCKGKMNDFEQLFAIFIEIGYFHYPEILENIFLLNQDYIKDLNLRKINKLIPKKIQSAQKIQILGDNFINKLTQQIPIESIPKFLGGKCQCNEKYCMNNDLGPY